MEDPDRGKQPSRLAVKAEDGPSEVDVATKDLSSDGVTEVFRIKIGHHQGNIYANDGSNVHIPRVGTLMLGGSTSEAELQAAGGQINVHIHLDRDATTQVLSNGSGHNLVGMLTGGREHGCRTAGLGARSRSDPNLALTDQSNSRVRLASFSRSRVDSFTMIDAKMGQKETTIEVTHFTRKRRPDAPSSPTMKNARNSILMGLPCSSFLRLVITVVSVGITVALLYLIATKMTM